MTNPKKIYSIKKPIPLARRRRDFKFYEHNCSEECSILEKTILKDNPDKFIITDDSILVKNQSPLLVPLYFEFKRKNEIDEPCGYLSPCGVLLYNMKDIYNYLKITCSKLNINQFCLTTRIELWRDHSYFEVYAYKKDISNGLESIPIQGINEHQSKFWDNFNYIKESKFSINSNLIKELLNEDNLAYCDCDDCSDLEKCKCRQLTVEENKLINSDNKLGYEFNLMLREPSTAIYECNSRCKCKKNCLNRVVQNGIKVRLQVFKTTNRGFGLRTLHDIPKGMFVCSYEGNIVENKNLETNNPYLMNLNYDYILKTLKESKENNLIDNQQISTNDEMQIDEDMDKNNEEMYEVCKKYDYNDLVDSDLILPETDSSCSSSSSSSFSDLTKTDASDTSSDEDQISNDDLNSNEANTNTLISTDYLIDTREFGNISRFVNHSCNPNLTVYPVYIKTQNPNFISIAFFANKDIKAFNELTINYFFGNKSGLNNFKCCCKSSKCISRNY